MSVAKITKNSVPLHVNRMNGRMLRLKAPKNKNREILVIYGHHASLERMTGIVEVLNRYGAVTVPDLPGFGGMDSFYKIGKNPTLDDFADYLASFIKLNYKRRRLTIVGMSFSFLIVTRMLQKNPEIAKKVDLLISFAGFVHKDDFRFKKMDYYALKTLAKIASTKPVAFALRYLALNKLSLKIAYSLVANTNPKMKNSDKRKFNDLVKFETNLWQVNDVQTRMKTMSMMFNADLCNQKVNLKVRHIKVDDDRYFNNEIVEQHMRIIYSDFESIESKVTGHMPTVIASAKEAAPFLPNRIRRLLRES